MHIVESNCITTSFCMQINGSSYIYADIVVDDPDIISF